MIIKEQKLQTVIFPFRTLEEKKKEKQIKFSQTTVMLATLHGISSPNLFSAVPGSRAY